MGCVQSSILFISSRSLSVSTPGPDTATAPALLLKRKSINNINDEELPPIRLIDYDNFKCLKKMPRCPENMDLLVEYDTIDRDKAIFIFFSHCWLRGWPGAPGWDGRPHPDTENHDKFKLMVEAVDKIMSNLTTMKKCYVWLDYACINQDASACLELKMLDLIVGVCDIILTNVFDAQLNWELPVNTLNIFDEYKSPAWNGDSKGYLSRGWTRVEMLYAANVPLIYSSPQRIQNFKAGLFNCIISNRRPHLLYGTIEQYEKRSPIQLPPMQNAWFDNYSPVNGTLTKEADRVHIQRLVDEIMPHMKRIEVGYFGELDKSGKKHGKGIQQYADGAIYDGMYQEDKRNGYGILKYSCGEVYIGNYCDDLCDGYGEYYYSDGTIYKGNYVMDQRDGKGILLYADGSKYEGEYKEDDKHGHGTYNYVNSDVYTGMFYQNKRHGEGTYTFADGRVQLGLFQDDLFIDHDDTTR